MKSSATIIKAAGVFGLLALTALGTRALDQVRRVEIKELTREAGEKIQTMRLQHNAEVLEATSVELRAHEDALKALRESRRKGSQLQRPSRSLLT